MCDECNSDKHSTASNPEKQLTLRRCGLNRKSEKQRHFLSFMEKLFKNSYVEVPVWKRRVLITAYLWCIPSLKNGKIQEVFDSYTNHNKVSLNNMQISGPDLSDTLVGALTHLSKETAEYQVHIFGNNPSPAIMIYCLRQSRKASLITIWLASNQWIRILTSLII